MQEINCVRLSTTAAAAQLGQFVSLHWGRDWCVKSTPQPAGPEANSAWKQPLPADPVWAIRLSVSYKYRSFFSHLGGSDEIICGGVFVCFWLVEDWLLWSHVKTGSKFFTGLVRCHSWTVVLIMFTNLSARSHENGWLGRSVKYLWVFVNVSHIYAFNEIKRLIWQNLSKTKLWIQNFHTYMMFIDLHPLFMTCKINCCYLYRLIR